MIAPMLKFELTALSSDRAALLRALQKTQLVQPVLPEEALKEEKGDAARAARVEELSRRLGRVRSCVAFLTAQAPAGKQEDAVKEGLKNAFLLSFDDFAGIAAREEELLAAVARAEALADTMSGKKSARGRLAALEGQLLPYLAVPQPLSCFSDTKSTKCFFGIVDERALPALGAYAEEEPLCGLTVFAGGRQVPVSLVCHEAAAERTEAKLSELGFARCTLALGGTPSEEREKLESERKRLLSEEEELSARARAELPLLKDLKIYADHLAAECEKAALYERLFKTQSTFTLGGYVPKEEKEGVERAVAEVTEACILSFSAPTEEDTPPTLLKNKGPAKAAEFITNMYSVPDYREYDPNGFVFVFFMLFFGLIMADIGYGVLLFLGGLILARRRKIDDGVKKLAVILTYGGVFTAVFGALFGSCFGVSLYTFLPDPSAGSRTNVLTILLGCLALGLLHITVGYVLSAVNSFRKGHVADAVCDALSWVLFCVGLFFAVFNFLTGYFAIPVAAGVKSFFGTMTIPGIAMLGAGLLLAAVTAGRKEKFFGKLTKGFGAVYGIINLLSDILSYARLFGLMLSGMIIAQQFNGIGLDLIAAGGVGFVFGPVVMLIGHAFNLAMGVLGAYIHDCRLQYIEFFSKFYTGEGALFEPLCSHLEYTHFIKNK